MITDSVKFDIKYQHVCFNVVDKRSLKIIMEKKGVGYSITPPRRYVIDEYFKMKIIVLVTVKLGVRMPEKMLSKDRF